MTALRWLNVATETAREAGALLKAQWSRPHTVHSKGYRDIVTESDLAAEQLILSRLRAAFPDHAITSEEAGADAGDARVRWLIDPLDGTTNFAHHNPNFCVSIAAAENGRPVVGVIYDPLRDELFAARRGGGATFNGAPLRTSGATALDTVTFSADWPREPALRADMWRRAGTLLPLVRTLRCLGSAALNMVYVAAGRLDLYMARTLSPWDQGAAALIVQEAGGVLGTLAGVPWTLARPDPVAAATPALLAAFHAVSRENHQ